MQVTQQNDVLYLKGEATITALSAADFHALEEACRPNVAVVDLSGLTRADSGCVALLLAAKRYLGKQTWQLQAAPSAVTALLQLYELEWLA